MDTTSDFSDHSRNTTDFSAARGITSTSDSEDGGTTSIGNTPHLSNESSDRECDKQDESEPFAYRLQTALENNDVEKLNKLLSAMPTYEVDLALTNDSGLALLDGAANKGYAVVVRTLLENGVDPDIPDHILYTPINNAAFNGHADVVLVLLESGKVNPNLYGKSGLTPINSAACNGHINVVQAFLRYDKVNLNLPDKKGCTPINNAAIHGHDDVVKILLQNEEVDPNLPDKEGRTPICNAAKEGHLFVVIALRNNARIDSTLAGKDGLTPIDWAEEMECKKIAEVLQSQREH